MELGYSGASFERQTIFFKFQVEKEARERARGDEGGPRTEIILEGSNKDLLVRLLDNNFPVIAKLFSQNEWVSPPMPQSRPLELFVSPGSSFLMIGPVVFFL